MTSVITSSNRQCISRYSSALLVFLALFLCGTVASAQLSGTYTIGGTSPSYATIAAALSALNTSGVSGPVTFRIRPGTYTPPTGGWVLGNIASMNSTNTVTIRPDAGTVILSGNTGITSQSGVFTIDGGHHFIIDGSNSGGSSKDMTILQTETNYNPAVFLKNNADNNTVKNCVLQCSAVSYSSTYGMGAIFIGGTNTTSGNDNNLIQNCLIGDPAGINRGYVGVGMYGQSTTYPNTNNTVDGCEVINFRIYGIYVENYNLNPLIKRNTIHQTVAGTSPSVYGVSINETAMAIGAVIEANKIYRLFGTSASSRSVYAIYHNMSNIPSGTTTIRNNMISFNEDGYVYFYGIYLNCNESTSGITYTHNVYNNSVYSGGTATQFAQAMPFYRYAYNSSGVSNTTVNHYNNIYYCPRIGGSSTSYGMYVYASPSGGWNSNNNVIALNSAPNYYTAYYNFSLYLTLPSYQTSGQDPNSNGGNPYFVDPVNGDLHIQSAQRSAVEGKGTPIASVTTDFDGDSRNASTPDIGADEVSALSMLGFDAAADHFDTPLENSSVPANTAFSPVGFIANYSTFTTMIGARMQLINSSNTVVYNDLQNYNVPSRVWQRVPFNTTGNVSGTTSLPAGVYTMRLSAELVDDSYTANDVITTTIYIGTTPPVCGFALTGTPGQGSASMLNGDSLLNTQTTIYGNETSYTPFTISYPATCAPRSYTMSISGPSATEYRFNSTGNLIATGTLTAGGSVTPGITFRPAGFGKRPATLSVIDNTTGVILNYNLAAIGGQRLGVAGNVVQGGTAAMTSGDTLFKSFYVTAGTTNNWTPFTASNLSTMGFAPSMDVTYTISGANAAYYSIAPGSTSLGSAGANTPTITFNAPTTVGGAIPATLTITADGNTKVYTLYPTVCVTVFTGLTGTNRGGTSTLISGDVFFSGFGVMLGDATTYTPFYSTMINPACSGTYTMTITGPNAADYYFGTYGTQTRTVNFTPGMIDTAKIGFRPGALGQRDATLTVTSTAGYNRTYVLAANGLRRIFYIGDVAQGGTAAMSNGDTLLTTKSVLSGTSQGYQPFTSTNMSTMNLIPGANVTYAITGGGGFYSIAPPSATLGSGQNNKPTITFAPPINTMGPQVAMLSIGADGQTFNYPLKAIATTPRGEFRLPNPGYNVRETGANNMIIPQTEMFYNMDLCVGEGASPMQINVFSLGNLPLRITGVSIRELDTTVGQGTGPYTVTNRPSKDYIFTMGPGTVPYSANIPYDFSTFSLDPGQQTSMYVNFVPQRTGKRYARAYIQTNSQNFSGVDASGATVLGLLTFDLFGIGDGARPATPGSSFLKPMLLTDTRVGTSSTTWGYITNRGICNLLINKAKLEFFSGDITMGEYKIIVPFSSPVDAKGNYVIAPGAVDSILIKFTPIHVGSRRATILLQTNDSTFNTNGNTERGAYYWDAFGVGTSSLAISMLRDGSEMFPPGVIDGLPTEVSSSTAEIRNTLTNAITMTKIWIDGPDAADFKIDPATMPTLPKLLTPAEIQNLLVVFKPASGSAPGIRTAMLRIQLESGDTLTTLLSAEAGTRVLSVTPSTQFDNLVVPVGSLLRRIVIVKNNGTLPLTLTSLQITGVDSLAYTITPLPRNLLVGGQTEFVEITFKPLAAGATVAKFEASGNQSNGMQSVTLGGKGVRIKGKVDPSDVTSKGTDDPAKTGVEEKVETRAKDTPVLKMKK